MRRSTESLAGKAVHCLAVALMMLLLAGFAAAGELGTRAPAFRLEDTGGKVHSLQDYANRVVVVAFWSFKCPVSLAYDERLGALQERYRQQGVAVIAVAANANESATEIRRNVANLQLPYPVLIDGEGTLAGGLGATHTPGIFVLDGAGVVRYRGAFDNGRRVGESGRIAHAEDAVQDILARRPVAVPETRPFGCTLKR